MVISFKQFILHESIELDSNFIDCATCDEECDSCDDCKEKDTIDVFPVSESDQELYYFMEYNEKLLTEQKIVIRVTSRGKRIRRIQCPPGRVLKMVNGKKMCVTQTGVEKFNKKIAVQKANRTKKSKGEGYKRKINRKRTRAIKKRKEMGL